MPVHSKKQQGFTLLELLVVVAVMAIISGMGLMRYGNVRSDNEEKATRVEMAQLRQAIIRYFNDQNTYSEDTANIRSPADIDFLTNLSYSWDVDYRKGWRGPYINISLTTAVDIANNTIFDFAGGGDPADDSAPLITVPAKLDPYQQPYLFFDLDPASGGIARIVSMGADATYDNADDVVLEI